MNGRLRHCSGHTSHYDLRSHSQMENVPTAYAPSTSILTTQTLPSDGLPEALEVLQLTLLQFQFCLQHLDLHFTLLPARLLRTRIARS